MILLMTYAVGCAKTESTAIALYEHRTLTLVFCLLYLNAWERKKCKSVNAAI
jgi:hypothetical protein